MALVSLPPQKFIIYNYLQLLANKAKRVIQNLGQRTGGTQRYKQLGKANNNWSLSQANTHRFSGLLTRH